MPKMNIAIWFHASGTGESGSIGTNPTGAINKLQTSRFGFNLAADSFAHAFLLKIEQIVISNCW